VTYRYNIAQLWLASCSSAWAWRWCMSKLTLSGITLSGTYYISRFMSYKINNLNGYIFLLTSEME